MRPKVSAITFTHIEPDDNLECDGDPEELFDEHWSEKRMGRQSRPAMRSGSASSVVVSFAGSVRRTVPYAVHGKCTKLIEDAMDERRGAPKCTTTCQQRCRGHARCVDAVASTSTRESVIAPTVLCFPTERTDRVFVPDCHAKPAA